MKRCRLFLAVMILLVQLQGCGTEERKETAALDAAQSEPAAELQVTVFAEEGTKEYLQSDQTFAQTYTELFDEIRSVTASNEEVIYLPAAPYETVGSILVALGDRRMEYSFFTHHSDVYLKDARNVIYVTLSEKGDTRG